MDLRHLRYFVAVAEEGGFTAAAQRLQVVQSGVSAVIRALERDLGAPLFDRGARGAELTEAGAVLLPTARAALAAAQSARDAVADVARGVRGTLRIGELASVPVVDLPALLGRFHRHHPEVRIQLRRVDHGSSGMVRALADGLVDVAFVTVGGPAPPGVRLRQLGLAPHDLVVPVGHRLAGHASITLADVVDDEFIDFPVGYGNRIVTDRAFAIAGLARRVSIEITEIATAAAYVRNGLGITLLPRFAVGPDAALRVVPVTGADLDVPLTLATPTGRPMTAPARALVDLIATTTSSAGAV